LLRFHFSLFLLPVYLFALSQLPAIDRGSAFLVFFILHLLVYPSSNGYNSYMDRDETPIGGLKNPLQPTKQLYRLTIAMDILAVALGFFLSVYFAIGVLLYILASRAYSYRKIRLKKYPIPGFLTVFIFQGALVFFLCYHAIDRAHTLNVPLLPAIISSFLIGALYPLTQVYQHEADKKDGVITISYLLGRRGTFVFSMICFLGATGLMYVLLHDKDEEQNFICFLLVMSPVVLFFLYWMQKQWKDAKAASFENSLRMNMLSTLCTSIFFIYLIIFNH
jgi:1,4-dihydroxy-2-naphthoate polyprenyltransferase